MLKLSVIGTMLNGGWMTYFMVVKDILPGLEDWKPSMSGFKQARGSVDPPLLLKRR
ncbi:unnamed protein product [marine sediment metagenome]|uniref:Uncharacterized protein n=1 Tax=marine sediment metagenome TaxID=412755 RepID=X1ICA7_9ZZZZ